MKNVTSSFPIRSKKIKDLIDALKILDPDLPLNDFRVTQTQSYETYMGEPTAIQNTYNFEFTIEGLEKLKK